MRDQIYRLVSKAHQHDYYAKMYNYFICIVAVLSVVPLMFKEETAILSHIDLITVYILFLDYILRWIVADHSSHKYKGWKAFILYPITPMAILDLVSILPSLNLVSKGWRVFRIFRITKLFRYSKNFNYIIKVFEEKRETLMSVLVLALGYIFISALAMFSYEPDTFETFYDALYWATTALTTVGYGDVYPVTDVGQFISMVSSIFGVAVIALPAGIITGGFLEAIAKESGGAKDE